MTITNRDISDTLSRYLASHPGEHDSLAPLLSSLAAGTEVTTRSATPGHVTCGAAVINTAGKILMIHHNALDRWLLPGGHLDPADPRAARRGAARTRRGDRRLLAAGSQPARPGSRPARHRPAPDPRQPGQGRARALARRLPLRLPRNRPGHIPPAGGGQRPRLATAVNPADRAPRRQGHPPGRLSRSGAPRGQGGSAACC